MKAAHAPDDATFATKPVLAVARIVRQIPKNPLPHSCFGPTGEALMDGFVLAVPLGQIVPTGTRTNHPKNSVHKQSIISTRAAWI